jgi:hypothetical protein
MHQMAAEGALSRQPSAQWIAAPTITRYVEFDERPLCGQKLPLAGSKSNFRFTPESRLNSEIAACPKSANKRLMHRSNYLLYSITWSARSKNDSGIVRPSDLAVLRLMTSSNLVGLRPLLPVFHLPWLSARRWRGLQPFTQSSTTKPMRRSMPQRSSGGRRLNQCDF